MSSCKPENVRCHSVFFLFVWSILASSCCGYANWIYPSAELTDLTFNYIDTVYFTWTSNIKGPWMNLWCSPTTTSAQSLTYLNHKQVLTNGTDPQSFPYIGYLDNGVCHMQLEDFAGDDWANTPIFHLTSNDAVAPQTWGLSALSLLGGASQPTTTVSSSSTGLSSAVVATALVSSSSSSSSTTSSSSTKSSSSSSTTSSSSFSTTSSSSSSSSSSSPAASPATTTTTTTRGAAPPTSPSSPPNTLTTAAKAGIGIGSVVCVLSLIILVLLFRRVRSRRTKGEEQDLNGFGTTRPSGFKDTAEIGEGHWHEINGVARPSELHGTPRAELEWAPRIELNSGLER